MKDFYVYLHKRKTDGTVFYIGKGSGSRAFYKNSRNRHWNFVAKKNGYTVEIYATGLQEWYAFELERDLISYYGKENLCNYTDGGDGPSGKRMTEEQKEHLRKIFKNRIFSEETIKKMSDAAKIRSSDPEYQKRRTKNLIGKKHSKEHIEKIRIAGFGRVLSDESRKKISDFHKGKKKNPEAVLAMARSKSKKVLCITNGVIYESTRDAARKLGISSSKVGECASGVLKKTSGYIFEYIK